MNSDGPSAEIPRCPSDALEPATGAAYLRRRRVFLIPRMHKRWQRGPRYLQPPRRRSRATTTNLLGRVHSFHHPIPQKMQMDAGGRLDRYALRCKR